MAALVTWLVRFPVKESDQEQWLWLHLPVLPDRRPNPTRLSLSDEAVRLNNFLLPRPEPTVANPRHNDYVFA